MHFSMFTGAAVLLALAPAALAVGSATVVNNCGFPIYYASVGQGYTSEMKEIDGSYTEQYSKHNVGISIKLAMTKTSSGPVSQFEFTWADGKIAYDLSNIDGYPFSAGGMTVVPSIKNDASNPTCVDVECPAGQAVCTAAYNQPDDIRTMVCSEQADLVLTMCPGRSDRRSDNITRRHPRQFLERS